MTKKMSHRKQSILFPLLSVIMTITSCQRGQPENNKAPAPPKFAGSAACKSCHAKEYADWKKSDHFLAMQPANDSTVLGDFNNRIHQADGVTNKFFKREGKFYVQTQGEDGKDHDYEILYTFGFYPLQQYLVSFPGGRMQSLRVCWDSRDKRWFHQYPGQNLYHHDWLHWTGNSQNWNTMCASCHSTDLQKNYDFSKDSYNTTWSEVNVSCESCHGQGSSHVLFVQSPAYKNGERLPNSGLHFGKNHDPELMLNTCAACHARKAALSSTPLRTNEIMDDLIPQVISDEFYFADGQIREEDYEYGSFVQSKMFNDSVRCSHCHNPHSGKLVLTGNALCMSCHQPKYNTMEHHFHIVNTGGAACINCHMTTKTYMGVDQRRDHSFRIPRPDQSVVYGTPNACTNCHSDKSAKWAADVVKKKYGDKRAYHFSDDLLPGSQLTDKSEKHLIRLLSDTTQPEIARATAAHYLANIQSPAAANALVTGLSDRKALVRYHSIMSLQNFPPQIWQSMAIRNLTDNVRAVRIAAADLYHGIPYNSIPSAAKGAYAAADIENKTYLQYQTDFAVGNVMLADYELQSGDQINAIQHYIRGLKKDSLMNYARINLSAAYSGIGKNEEALKTLKEAAAIDQTNDRIFYNLGLLYYEIQDIPGAVTSFEKATRLGSTIPGVYYNYGVLLQRQNKLKEAEQTLLSGYSLDPTASNINYALAYLYLQKKLPQRALRHARVLQQTDPSNPNYQQLFRTLGL